MQVTLKYKILIIIIAIGLLIFGTYKAIQNRMNSEEGLDNDISTGEIITEKTEEKSDEDDYIYVHIIGEVKNNGIIKLKAGDRLINAIEAAGGVTEQADLSQINLAYVLSDGNKIRIPNINDKNDNTNYITNGSGENVIIGEEKNNAKININIATQSELETITGVGPSTAAKIIEYRNKNGKFKKIEDLKKVGGIGEGKFNNLKDEITVK